ncbi:winged helix-turn-helix domain-containing protein [Gloeomargarita sp.]
MALPDYQSLMLPLLQYAGVAEGEITTSKAVEFLAQALKLTEADLKEMLPNGTQSTFVNRVGWAATYMKKAGLLASTRRGYYRITERGRQLLAEQPQFINNKTLKRYPEFREFINQKRARADGDKTILETEL